MERGADTAARSAADAIRSLNNARDNPGNHEFGTFVLRLNDGRYVSAFPTEGNTGAVSLRAMFADARLEFGGSIGVSNIVGIVHLHPSEAGVGFVNSSSINDLSALDYGNTMPSHPNIGTRIDPSTGRELMTDWSGARLFLESNGHTNIENVSHYILGPDGVLREYDYSDPHPTENTEQHSEIENAAKDAGGTC